jgi:hypothetical protein
MPAWVKISVAVAAVLIAGVIAALLVGGGGGEHGPGRHSAEGVTTPDMATSALLAGVLR